MLAISTDFRQVLTAIGRWMYQLTQINIPGLNVSAWMLGLTLLIFTFAFRIFDVFNHRSTGAESNNNIVYRGDN